MKNEKLGLAKKGRGKRWFLPSAALIVGLCVPIYAYAYDQAACNACNNACQNNEGTYGYQCTQAHPGDDQGIYNCVASMMSSCHLQCYSTVCR